VPDGPFEIEEIRTDGQSPSLADRVAKKLGSAGAFSSQHAARSIRLSLDEKVPAAWADGHVSVGALWGLYAQYPYMPRLRGREVLVDALDNQPLIWQSEGFAIADGYDSESGTYSGLWLPGEKGRSAITDSSLIVKPARAEAQRAAEKPIAPTSGDDVDTDSESSGSEAGTRQGDNSPGSVITSKPTARRFVGSAPISGDRYSGDFAKIAAEVIANLAAAPGVKLTLNISIDAVAPGGFTEQQIRTIRENASTLKFTTNEFEEA